MSEVTITTVLCPNCGTDLNARYCANCGQKAAPLNPTLYYFLRDLIHEITHLDSKLLRTLRLLLTKPGFLTQELRHGRRASYVPPIRLYLVFSVAAFAGLAMLPRDREIVTDLDLKEVQEESGFTMTDGGPNFSISGLTPDQRRKLGEDIFHMFPRVMFMLLPVCALLFMLFARRARLNYPQHLYFALHVHAAYFAVLALTLPVELLGTRAGGLVSLARVVYILPYTAIAFRRVYGYSRPSSSLRVAVVFGVYMTVVGIAFIFMAIAAYYMGRT